jgi:hypothetical protein
MRSSPLEGPTDGPDQPAEALGVAVLVVLDGLDAVSAGT